MKQTLMLTTLISNPIFSQESVFNIGTEKNEKLETTLKTTADSLYVFGQRANSKNDHFTYIITEKLDQNIKSKT